MILPSVGPLEVPCTQSIDELIGVKALSELGRCGRLDCCYCVARALIGEVAATARILAELGGRAMVAAFHSIPPGLPPEEVHALIEPRFTHALVARCAKYIGGLEARWTLEQDAEGLANAHVVLTGRSTPKVGALRRALREVGLGRNVEIQHEVLSPVSLACYSSKVGLLSFALPPPGRPIALSHALRFGGGAFARATAGFYGGTRSPVALDELGARHVEDVIRWAVDWDGYADKTPPGLRADLSALGIRLPERRV